MFAISLKNIGLLHSGNTILEGINLDIPYGSFCLLTGESGSGKTSILRMLYMDLKPTWGEVNILGKNIKSTKNKSELRKSMGIIFQDFKLIDELTVMENVILPLKIRDFPKIEATKQAKKMLNWAGITNHDIHPQFLSGGEKQRVGIVRAVICRPEILIADEIIESLDQKNAKLIISLIEELNKIGVTVIMSTHNENLMKNENMIHFAIKNKSIIKY